MSVDRNSCYAKGRSPQIFLSLETRHERRALPYTLLLEVEMASDARLLQLTFSHYEVLVKGGRLEEIYESVREATCTAIRTSSTDDRYSTERETPAYVTEVRIKRLEVSA